MVDIFIGRTLDEIEEYGKLGTIFIGKEYIKMENVLSLANEVYLDVNRPHLILIAGKRGQGKCVLPNTKIYTLKGAQEIEKIFIKLKKKLVKKSDNEELYRVLENFTVLSLGNDLKIRPAKVSYIYRKYVREKLIKIKTQLGYEITVTKEHPLLTIDKNGNLIWKRSDSFSEGDFIAIARNIKFQRLSVTRYIENILKQFEEIDKNLYKLGRSKPFYFNPRDPEFLKNLLRFIGYWLGDGGYQKLNTDRIYITCFDKNIREHIKHILQMFKVNYREDKSNIYINNKSFAEFLKMFGLELNKTSRKRIPPVVFYLDDYLKLELLAGIIDTDGHINERRGIEFIFSSKSLSEDIVLLLHSLGIVPKVCKKKIMYNGEIREYTRIIINITFLKELKNLTNLLVSKKKEKLIKTICKKRNPNIDVIPAPFILKVLKDKYKIKEITSGYIKGDFNISRQKLCSIVQQYEIVYLTSLVKSDIFWDKIVEISEIFYEGWVYDLTIPIYHNFIANGIISHNSYTLASIAESMVLLPKELSQNLSVIIFDTMGIFWTMKFPNYRDAELLEKWGLKPQGLKQVRIYVPEGLYDTYKKMGVPVDKTFTINPSDLSGFEWNLVFNIKQTSPLGIFIQRIIRHLRKSSEGYGIEDIISYIEKLSADPKLKEAAINYFEASVDWGLFSEEAQPLIKLAEPGKVVILDISGYTAVVGGWSIKSLVVGIVSKKIFYYRMLYRKKEEIEDARVGLGDVREREMPLVWLMIDEAHEVLPKDSVTPASEPLIQIIREGRQPGVSLVLATQQPGKMHTDVITQSDIVISHRVTAQQDLKALNEIMHNFVATDIEKYMNEHLPKKKGSALILDDKSERIYPVQMKPRVSWHGGQDPSVIRKKIL